MHVCVHLCTCLVIASFHYGSAGGRAALQHCNEINDPWFFRCDQQTKLSSHSETKGVTGGKQKVQRTEATRIRLQMWKGFMPVQFSVGSVDKHQSYTYIHTVHLSLLPPPSHPPLILSAWNLLPNAARLSHLCRKWIVSQSPLSQGFTCKECSFIGWTD